MTAIKNTGRARDLRKNQTNAEALLWAKLRNRGLDSWKFKRQVPKGRYIVDFYCAEARLVIELDGQQHAYDEAVVYDQARTRFLQESGLRVIRFWNCEIYETMPEVLECILQKLNEPPFPDDMAPSLSPAGRGSG